MITLHLTKGREWTQGEVVHLKVKSIYQQAPGKWRLMVDDVTPLPGAEPTAYACGVCGIVEPAKEDGSLPEGWIIREYAEGSHFVCADLGCQEQKTCRICGCTALNACKTDEGPCYWVEDDLCSACVEEGAPR